MSNLAVFKERVDNVDRDALMDEFIIRNDMRQEVHHEEIALDSSRFYKFIFRPRQFKDMLECLNAFYTLR